VRAGAVWRSPLPLLAEGRSRAQAYDQAMAAVLVVSPNLTLDHICILPRLSGTSGVYRADVECLSAGGKGMNVARALRLLGADSAVIGFSAGAVGSLVEHLAASEGLRVETVPVAGETRIGTVLVHGRPAASLVVNPPGPRVDPVEWQRLIEVVISTVERERPPVVICAGSIPVGMDADGYNAVLSGARAAGAFTVLDAASEVLAQGLRARPSLVKVNLREAGAVTGARDPFGAASALRAQGASAAVITLGGDGAVAESEAGRFEGFVAGRELAHATGAGDAFLAGYVAALLKGSSPIDSLADGLAAGTASTETFQPGNFDVTRRDELRRLVDVRHVAERPVA
jgi:tagatose 6-phosphate kinase